MIEVIAIGSDNLVRLDALNNASTGAYVNNATVSFTLKDASGTPIVSNVSMAYVAGTNGRYEGTITNTGSAALTNNGSYTIEITANSGGVILFRKLSCVAYYRSAQ